VRQQFLTVILTGTFATALFAQTTITYQGKLESGGEPFNGTAEMIFELHEADTGDTEIDTHGPVNVEVSEGLFQEDLSFGAGAFDGDPRYLQIIIDGTPLAERHPIRPSPMALYAFDGDGESGEAVWELTGSDIHYDDGHVGIGTASPGAPLQVAGSVISGAPDNTVTGENSFVSGGDGGSLANHVPGDYAFVAGGRQNEASGDQSVVSGFNNQATDFFSVVLGGYDNVVSGNSGFIGGGRDNVASGSNAFVAGGRDNLAEGSNSFAAGRHAHALHSGAFVWSDSSAFASDFTSTADDQFLIRTNGGVGINTNSPGAPLQVSGSGQFGFDDNEISGENNFVTGGFESEFQHWPNIAEGSIAAAIVGGGGNTITADGDASAIAGGRGNIVETFRSFIGGGKDNKTTVRSSAIVGGEQNTTADWSAAILGGRFNVAGGQSAAVAGGQGNEATGSRAAIAGGTINTASGDNAFIGGGSYNTADAENTFAAGAGAQALHANSFVWSGGGSERGVESTAENQFVVAASGAVQFLTDETRSMGVELAPGGSGWSVVSDRHAKTTIEAVDPVEVLNRVVELEVSEYSYKSQDESIRHMGPMAQDFHPLFGLGEDELRVSPMNLAGIALAAIQGLNAERQADAQRLARVEAENAELRDEIAGLQDQVAANSRLAEKNAELEDRLAALEALLLEDRQVAEGP